MWWWLPGPQHVGEWGLRWIWAIWETHLPQKSKPTKTIAAKYFSHSEPWMPGPYVFIFYPKMAGFLFIWCCIQCKKVLRAKHPNKRKLLTSWDSLSIKKTTAVQRVTRDRLKPMSSKNTKNTKWRHKNWLSLCGTRKQLIALESVIWKESQAVGHFPINHNGEADKGRFLYWEVVQLISKRNTPSLQTLAAEQL